MDRSRLQISIAHRHTRLLQGLMTNSSELDEVRAAIAALEAGETNLAAVETLIGNGLSAGSFTQAEAGVVLRDAVQAGTVSEDTILRLLGRDAIDAEQSIGGVGADVTLYPNDDRTRLRPQSRPSTGGSIEGNRTNSLLGLIAPRTNSVPRSGTDAEGQILSERYLLERKLGQGGMGVVYFARDQQVSGESFAIKLLKPEICELPEALEMVREEVRKTRSLAHPNIVGVYSVNADRTNVFILMEYLDGKTLDTLIDDDFGRGMPFSRAWPLIQDICSGLGYAHDHSVIHSDLKPSNIFITTSGKAKLLDFGIARAARGGSGRFDPATLGALTPAYASCEMLEQGKPDQRDDIYSLGCVVYEMLSGARPFDRPTALDARRDELKVPLIASLTKRQNAALAQALSFDREKRTGTVEALLAGLAPRGDGGSGAARSRRVFWVAGSGVAVLLAGIIWFLNQDKVKVPPSPSASSSEQSRDGAIKHIQALAARARALDINPSDPLLQQGAQQLADGQRNLAAGAQAEGERMLAEAERSLRSAIATAKRVAHLGSSPDEVALAMRLCQLAGGGCSAADFADESLRTASLSPFELDKTEVTNREFGSFATATSYVTAPERREGGVYSTTGSKAVLQPGVSWRTLRDAPAVAVDASNYPVRGVDFKSADDYCKWRGERLPTEDEWEYVARGDDHRIFAWGNDPRPAEPGTRRGPTVVNEQPMTGRFETRGLGDGVLEWADGGTKTERVLRGASWLDTNPVYQRLAMRRLLRLPNAFLDSGFRCAKSVESWPDRPRE